MILIKFLAILIMKSNPSALILLLYCSEELYFCQCLSRCILRTFCCCYSKQGYILLASMYFFTSLCSTHKCLFHNWLKTNKKIHRTKKVLRIIERHSETQLWSYINIKILFSCDKEFWWVRDLPIKLSHLDGLGEDTVT